jgi:hypothetical protein
METCTTASPVESGNRGNAELGACGVRGCTGVGVKKVARDVRFDVMAGRTRCLNVTRYNRARHTKGSFCSFPPRHTKRRRRSAGEGGRVARETHRGRPVRSPTTLLATLSPAGEEKGAPVGCIASRDQALQRVPGLPRRRRRRPPSFALLANGDTRKWVLTGPVSLRDGMEGGREAEGYNRAPFTPRAAKPVD